MRASTFPIDVDFSGESLREQYGSITVSIVRITPQVAKAWLELNGRNRKINRRHLDRLRQTFSAGDMALNGETVIFSEDGVLLDGQHRLTACILEDVPFVSLVVRGISPSAFDTIDGGLVRGVGDVLGMENVGDANKVSSAIQAFVSFCDNGGFLTQSCSLTAVRKCTPRLALRVLEEHPGLRDSVKEMSRNTLMKTQHGFALHYIFGLVSRRLAKAFADVLANGSPEDPHRPFNVLRESLVRSPMRNNNREQYASKAVLAFNAELAGERVKSLRVGHGRPMVDGLDVKALARSIE